MKIKKQYIVEEWHDEDGYWIALKAGWKWEDDPLGCVHTIHEDTKAQAHAQEVVRCECQECLNDGNTLNASEAIMAT
jgi:hypothetical protein